MHIYLMGHSDKSIDHKDCNGLNNTRAHLRFASNSQNQANRRKRETDTSKYKGVYWYPNKQKWHSAVSVNGKKRSLGYFTEEFDAAQAYNFAALEAHGEFARLNEAA